MLLLCPYAEWLFACFPALQELEFDREVYPIGVSLTEVSIIGALLGAGKPCTGCFGVTH